MTATTSKGPRPRSFKAMKASRCEKLQCCDKNEQTQSETAKQTISNYITERPMPQRPLRPVASEAEVQAVVAQRVSPRVSLNPRMMVKEPCPGIGKSKSVILLVCKTFGRSSVFWTVWGVLNNMLPPCPSPFTHVQ